ncbi:deoxynucleoside kinase [Patescibacteria group bacterium]|nr:deoxynucleoside kinase [Patescibacteria group bacterium]
MRKKRGKLVVRHGPMWSDKTTWLIAQMAGSPSLAFKPSIDNRYTDKAVLRSHTGAEEEAVLVDKHKPKLLWDKVKSGRVDRVIIDETNFFDDRLIKVINKIISSGIDVFAAGLLLDSDRKEFGPTKKLSRMADEVIEGRARCDFRYANGFCLSPAKYTFAKAKKSGQLVVGAADLYGAACEEHYHLLHVTKEKNGQWLNRLRLPQIVKLTAEVKTYLNNLKLPYLRRPLKFSESRFPRIEVGADTMRVGKTTAVKVLGQELKSRGLPVKVSFEDWRHNPHLTKSYKDSSLAILNSQKWFAKRKYEQLRLGAKKAIWIQDVHPEMDFCYALTNLILGRMTLKHFKDYAEYFYSFDWAHLPAADALLYLTASDEVVIARAKKNLRPFETIENDYFIVMKRVNQAWLAGTKYLLDVVVMPVNTDNFNFATSKGAKQKLAKKVLKKLAELGWRY